MKKNFKPMMLNDVKYKDYLLKGYILKMDGGGNDYVEVIERDCDQWHLRHNVGRNDGKHLPRFPKLLLSTIEALENDGYAVVKKGCDFSGCCQYHAYIYYIASKMP